ncbi:hypothetical protein [Bradyrhizobium prioriisuperbiae]|uniref:hypothetical protein n=1 Tax=Bradyrhizobium prioriisuperbiae TaxID=2854389 RepID=UPI0028F14090|nr:hypothetical protein [Bradyrhizobium prioritasuperba]
MLDKPASDVDYQAAAISNFTALVNLYSTNDEQLSPVSFWKLGNTFDTMIDFLDVINPNNANGIVDMVVTQLNASLKHIKGGYDGAWFDDFGWWSVATERALNKPFFSASARKQLQNVLHECWPRFTNNAPFVWQRHDPTTFQNYGPVVDGGVWNAYWTGTPDKYLGPKNGDPSNGSLVGIQNTVTNTLYLMAAQRLGRTDPVARMAAEAELSFLSTWLNETSTPLWWTLSANAGLVRERVGHFANVTPALGFQEKWAWTGDQGLMLGSLSDAMQNAAPNQRPALLARAQQIVAGVRQNLVDSNGVVISYTPPNYSVTPPIIVPDGDTSDYQVGSGVFWRNYLYVWKTNSALRSFLAGTAYQDMLRVSANAAMLSPDNPSLETLANQTAVLIAATALL